MVLPQEYATVVIIQSAMNVVLTDILSREEDTIDMDEVGDKVLERLRPYKLSIVAKEKEKEPDLPVVVTEGGAEADGKHDGQRVSVLSDDGTERSLEEL